MVRTDSLLCAAALIAITSAGPALAESLAASSASQSIGMSVGSVSTSLGTSSNSSSKTTTAAAGDYKVVALAAAPDRPGMLRATLQAVVEVDTDAEFYLYLPQAAAEQAGLVEGGIVTARQRPYGTEFAHASGGGERQAFFLVLADDWYRELQARAVQL
jgi:hypothetical protein